jgi:hypothetical protein
MPLMWTLKMVETVDAFGFVCHTHLVVIANVGVPR